MPQPIMENQSQIIVLIYGRRMRHFSVFTNVLVFVPQVHLAGATIRLWDFYTGILVNQLDSVPMGRLKNV